MLTVVSAAAALTLEGAASYRPIGASRAGTPVMMPKVLKELFPDLEKPDFSSITDAFASFGQPALPDVDVKAPTSGACMSAQPVPITDL